MKIETERLILRKFNDDDVSQVHVLFCDHETMRLVGMYPPFKKFEETMERISRWSEDDRHLAITLKETGELLGYIAVNPDSEEKREDTRELGFALISGYRNKGYMKEAVLAVLDELKKDNVVYVWACCFRENHASERLIRSMGFEFQQEGVFESANDRRYDSLEFRMKL